MPNSKLAMSLQRNRKRGISIEKDDFIERNIEYFDKHADIYEDASTKSGSIYPFYCKYLRHTSSRILDVGGGDGSFCTLLKKEFPEADVTLLEPSENLISLCKDIRIRKIHGNLPDRLNLEFPEKFNIIFIRFVLHHLAAGSIDSSKILVKASLLELKKHLDPDGYLIISETFYESNIIDTLMRGVIFYLLAIQNRLNSKIPLTDFQLNLRVCFYTRSELKKMIGDCGFAIIDVRDNYSHRNILKRFALKAWGFTDLVLRLNNEGK